MASKAGETMASQENGNGFTAIPNEVMEALCKTELSGQEFRIALLIIRKTFGFRKDDDKISLSQMSKATGIDHIRCSKITASLQTMKILSVTENIAGVGKTYRINTNLDQWLTIVKKDNPCPKKKGSVIKKDNANLEPADIIDDNNIPLSKKTTLAEKDNPCHFEPSTLVILDKTPLSFWTSTKETITKENITKERNITTLCSELEKPSSELCESENSSKAFSYDRENDLSSCRNSVPVMMIPILKSKKDQQQEPVFPIYQDMINDWSESYPAVDVMQELRNLRQWNIANPKRRKTKSGILRHINSWLTDKQNKGGNRGFKAIVSTGNKNLDISITNAHNWINRKLKEAEDEQE